MYDYFLGGAHHFPADREAAGRLQAVAPHVVEGLRANRGFLMRAVRWCAAVGITQFLDLGSGIPTMGNVHHVARAHQPTTRDACVDVDAVAVAHSRHVLGDEPRCWPRPAWS